MKINDGGPAFPMPSGREPRIDEITHYNEGMSLRDWFAGMAIQGLLTYVSGDDWVDGKFKVSAARTYSNAAGILADAMLKEREKPDKSSRPTSIIFFPNGLTVVYGDDGKQIPYYQRGLHSDVIKSLWIDGIDWRNLQVSGQPIDPNDFTDREGKRILPSDCNL